MLDINRCERCGRAFHYPALEEDCRPGECRAARRPIGVQDYSIAYAIGALRSMASGKVGGSEQFERLLRFAYDLLWDAEGLRMIAKWEEKEKERLKGEEVMKVGEMSK